MYNESVPVYTLLCKVVNYKKLWYSKYMKEKGSCPVTKAAHLMSDTWTMLIMHALITRPKRFCEIERSLDGISTRTLTLKLISLQEDNLIEKTDDGYYAATEKGLGLRHVENAMRRYALKYL